MEKLVLFSPVGTTDPITGFHDGAILHICRNYDISSVYMYFSSEINAFRLKDNRYTYCLEQLAKAKKTNISIHEIVKEDLKEVQIFDFFIVEFRKIISEILVKEKIDKIYINISSGTPAMKSALFTLCTISEGRYIPIQVSTPVKKYNKRTDDKEDYDPQVNWELDEDNLEDFQNRCSIASKINLSAELKCEMIVKQIKSYDYVAACSIAEEIQYYIADEAIRYLRAAVCRIQLDISGITKLLGDNKKDILPIIATDSIDIAEYCFWLQIKMLRHDYADFIRGLSPVIVEMMEKVLYRNTGIDINDYCYIQKIKYDNAVSKENNKYITVRKWDLNKLKNNSELYNTLNEDYNEPFKSSPVSSYHLLALIKKYCKNISITENAAKLRNIEENIRNETAHTIISVTEDKIKAKSGYSIEKIMSLIKEMAGYAGIGMKKEYWSTYDDMNNIILEKLGKER